jgi:hypothetical protein
MHRKLAFLGFTVLGAYIVAYFVCVQEGLAMKMGGRFSRWPTYRYFPPLSPQVASFFSPMHELDRRLLRPGKWEGRYNLSRVLIFPHSPAP